MNRFNSKEEISPLDDYNLRDAEKSSGKHPNTFTSLFSCTDNHAENHADSSSTYTGQDSGIFDPNYDSNSILGA